MATIEFRCADCGCTFVLVMSACEIGSAKPRCPKCDSERVEPVVNRLIEPSPR